MRIGVTVRDSWRWVRRQWRAGRCRLRRDRAVIALVALLSLGVFEPLICIIHCQIWLPIVLHSYFAAQHQHHHTPAAAALASVDTQPAVGAAIVRQHPLTNTAWCFINAGRGSSDTPVGTPLSPVHEVILALIMSMIFVLLLVYQVVDPPSAPPRLALPPPLRPPILVAA